MTPDFVRDQGFVFLGSRLKRLAERLQADAVRIHREAGVDAQPAELALLGAVDRLGPLTVTEAVAALGVSQPGVTRTAAVLVERGELEARADAKDQRTKTLVLTRRGRAVVDRAKTRAWPLIGEALAAACAGLEGDLLAQLAGLEGRLADRPLETRARSLAHARRDVLAVRDYTDDLAPAFYAINAAWIEAMFTLEEKDRQILSHPRETILDPGGFILFVESAELGVVGTCALMKVDEGVYELTKMGVLEAARGRKAGEALLAACLARASAMPIDTLYLLTNSRCVAAIALYEKLGFRHDADILATYGAAYARCDVGMRYPT